jgi:hypothetical protein
MICRFTMLANPQTVIKIFNGDTDDITARKEVIG